MFESIKEMIDKVVVTIKEMVAMLEAFIAGFKTKVEFVDPNTTEAE